MDRFNLDILTKVNKSHRKKALQGSLSFSIEACFLLSQTKILGKS